MAKTTNLARSLERAKGMGYFAESVEKWIPRANVRRDLFKCIDIVAVRANEQGVLGIQATSEPQLAAHEDKYEMSEELRAWLLAGNRFEMHGWYKQGRKWFVRVVPYVIDRNSCNRVQNTG